MITTTDKKVLRELAKRVADIASDKERHKKTAENWKRLNDMEQVRPMLYIYQIPWQELNTEGELTLQTSDDTARKMEENLLQTIYLWKHVPMDMVVEPFYTVPESIIKNTGYGVEVKRHYVQSDEGRGTPSSHYIAQINDEADIDKIINPVISCDPEAGDKQYRWTSEVMEGLMEVKRKGPVGFGFAPWDLLAMLCEPGKILLDMAMRPEFIHKLIGRLVDAYCAGLDQMEEMNLLSVGTNNFVIGNGGLGFTGDLPRKDYNPSHIKLSDQWGSGMAQIFSEVSPAMHEEFALQYEKKYLNRAGLVYYGCCEPLHRKVEITSKHLPNLRKISMSPWANAKVGAEAIGERFVFSFKPNPAFLATEGRWARESAKREIENVLDITKGRHLEIILKDISTVKHQPQRLWEWAEMVNEMVHRYE